MDRVLTMSHALKCILLLMMTRIYYSEACIPAEPTSLTVEEVDTTSAILSWGPPKNERECPPDLFEIAFQISPGASGRDGREIIDNGTRIIQYYELGGGEDKYFMGLCWLSSGYTYEVDVRAMRDNIRGPEAAINVTTISSGIGR